MATREFSQYHLRERQQPLAGQIVAYWSEVAAFPGVDEAWSGVFMSSCVRQADATVAEFKFSARHGTFIHSAIVNQRNGVGVFRADDAADYAPQLGDILHNNREGNCFDYAFASTHKEYKSHSAIVLEVGVDSKGALPAHGRPRLGRHEGRALDARGIVKNPDALYISAMQTPK